MKFFNDFKSLFAIVGVVSIIFWTCAADSDSVDNIDNPPQITSSVGKYQVASPSSGLLVILNTETGVLKTYVSTNSTNHEWTEGGAVNSTSGNILGSGNLTVTH